MTNPFERKDDFAIDFELLAPVQRKWGESPHVSDAGKRQMPDSAMAAVEQERKRNDFRTISKGQIFVRDSEGEERLLCDIETMEGMTFTMPPGVENPLDFESIELRVLGAISTNLNAFRTLLRDGQSVFVQLGSAAGKSEDMLKAFNREVERLQSMSYLTLDISHEQGVELHRMLSQAMSEGKVQPMEFGRKVYAAPPTREGRKGKGEKRRNRKDRWRGKGGVH